jgi:two-component system sensor histidine kinase YesM
MNALNAIKWMAVSYGHTDIMDMIASLGAILESALRNKGGLLTIREEVALLGSYVSIEKVRHPGEFEIAYDIDGRALELMTLNLLLQPLVENSLFYGIGQKPVVHVLVSCRLENGGVTLEVSDDGVGMGEEEIRKILSREIADPRHIGIQNIKKRIELTFGLPYGLSIRGVPGMGLAVAMRLPLVRGESGADGAESRNAGRMEEKRHDHADAGG